MLCLSRVTSLVYVDLLAGLSDDMRLGTQHTGALTTSCLKYSPCGRMTPLSINLKGDRSRMWFAKLGTRVDGPLKLNIQAQGFQQLAHTNVMPVTRFLPHTHYFGSAPSPFTSVYQSCSMSRIKLSSRRLRCLYHLYHEWLCPHVEGPRSCR